MENNNDIDIFYKFHLSNVPDEDELNNKTNPYFLIELKNFNPKKLSFDFFEKLLINDGVELNIIKEYKYFIKEKEKINNETHNLEFLNDTNILKLKELKNLDQIYLHLIVEEEQEIIDKDYINEKMEEYNLKIENYEKELNEISKGIEKEKIYNEKILSEYLFQKIEKNNFQKKINNEIKYNNTMIRK